MPEVREYGTFNMGKRDHPNISPRKRRPIWNWAAVGLLVFSLLGGYLSYWKFSTALKAQRLVTLPGAGADNVHVLKLVQLHHYGASSESGEHLVLNVDQRVKNLAGEHFKSSKVNVEDMWTSEARFATTNPFDYPFALRATEMEVTRLVERDPDLIDRYISYSYENPEMAAKNGLEWINEVVSVPDVTDKNTVMAVALMSSNAYVELPYTGEWRNLTDWTMSGNKSNDHYGWDSDGIRAHVFATADGSTIVFAIKGTSSQVLPGSGDDATSANDKLNDNLLFSCCCARVGYLWTTVCDCYSKSYTCDESCLERELRRHDRYYYAVVQMYKTVAKAYPKATIWLTGHSLGGSLASLLGRTYGLPAITFEAPGELLPAKRLHLPFPPGFPTAKEAIWHFGNTGDPIYMGTCNGASSTCSIAGYAMETKCHSGKRCTYDVVTDMGWRVNILNHRIHTVIDKVINEYENPPKCEYPELCQDCYNWNFFRTNDPYHEPPDEDNEDTSTTTSITTTTFLDPPTKITTAPETTTSKCVGRNWFGLCTEYSYYGRSPVGHSPTHVLQAI